MKSRRRIKQTQSLGERLVTLAQELRSEAKALPPGRGREVMLRKARQNEAAAEMSNSLAVDGTKTPA